MFQFFLLLLIATPMALLAAGSAGHAIAKKALKPLERMTEQAESITANNLHDRLEVKDQEDELGHIAKVFNHLLERLEQAFLQLQRFTADAAHELRTPLASLRAIGEVALQKGHNSQEYQEALANMLEESARLDDTIGSLLLLARAETNRPGNDPTIFIASDLVQEILDLLQVVIEEKHIRLLQNGDEVSRTVMLNTDRGLLRIAILNVLHNALKFAPDGSALQISYALVKEPVPLLEMSFKDEGPGIELSQLEQVFDRFFTGIASDGPSKSGTGLGLSIAQLVISRMGGNIGFDRDSVGGAKCVIRIPAYR